MVKNIYILLGFVFLMGGLPLWAQNASPTAPGQYDEQIAFIGMKLDDLYKRFGSPKTVYAARGGETWQDDVVFVYNEGDFYVYRDRVWQVGVKSIYGIRVGDAKAVVMLVLGENAKDEGDYALYSFSGGAWPLSLRVNYTAGKISAIYVYRPDY
jgi:hypothetical protein